MKQGQEITFQKGKSYRIHMPEVGEVRKIHIVEIVENDMIVYKFFGKNKQRWRYKIEHVSELQFWNKRAQEEKKTKSPL